MNPYYQRLVELVIAGQFEQARQFCRFTILTNRNIKTEADKMFAEKMLTIFEEKKAKEPPRDIENILVVEDYGDDPSHFPETRFLLRQEDAEEVDRILAIYRAAEELRARGVNFLPAAIFHGPSGCGKTMLARYVAYRAKLPFVYVRFANLINSHLGETGRNIGKIFEFVKTFPCVLCFDELDTVARKRGEGQDVNEMPRVATTIMQELDMLPSTVCVIGTTNIYEALDPAITRRFTTSHEVKPYTPIEYRVMAHKFFAAAQLTNEKTKVFCDAITAPEGETMTGAAVERLCAEEATRMILAGEVEPLAPKLPVELF